MVSGKDESCASITWVHHRSSPPLCFLAVLLSTWGTPENNQKIINSDIHSGVRGTLLFSAFICVDAFLQAEFPLF